MKMVSYDFDNELEELAFKGKKKEILTGFSGIDKRIGGLKASELIILASRPAMGKSSFALNIAMNVAKTGISTVLFNLESSKEQIVNRILASEAMVDSNKIRIEQLDYNDWMKIASASESLAKIPIYIDDTPGISVEEIQNKCKKLKMEKNIGLVVIDYLQLITLLNKKNESREQEVLEISRTLKKLAIELDIPIIILSHVSKSAEKRQDDKRPMISNLRESGAIVQNADIVMFIYREDYYNPDTSEKNIAEIIIAKNRYGEIGVEKIAWLEEYRKFIDLQK